jgi:hypothetical protein
VRRYADTKSVILEDVYGDAEMLDGCQRVYPDDLEKLISFIA